MSRRSRKEPDFLDELHDTLVAAPAWAGPLLAFLVFAALRWLVPWSFTTTEANDGIARSMLGTMAALAVKFAPWAAGGVIFVWLFALAAKLTNRRRLDRQIGIESIRRLSWRDFERLLAEAFRRQGYAVGHADERGPDGGVDLRLRRQGEVVLVQCKQWLTWSVGVKIVRELSGVVTAERATRGIVVTSGKFTADAHDFAQSVPMMLIDGDELAQLIADVQAKPMEASPPQEPTALVLPVIVAPQCPTCGAVMKLRTAKQGSRPGSQFWGCSKYPACRGTRPLASLTA